MRQSWQLSLFLAGEAAIAQNVIQGSVQHFESPDSGPFLPFITFGFGTPAQDISGIFDTGSSDVIVPKAGSAVCKLERQQCTEPAAVVRGQFDPKAASDFKPLKGDRFDATFGGGDQYGGEYMETTVTLGDNGKGQVPNAQVALATSSQPKTNLPQVPVFGVGPKLLEATGEKYDNLPEKTKEGGVTKLQAYSFVANATPFGNGSVFFGGIDRSKFEGELKEVPLEKDNSGQIPRFVVKMSSVKLVLGAPGKANGTRQQQRERERMKRAPWNRAIRPVTESKAQGLYGGVQDESVAKQTAATPHGESHADFGAKVSGTSSNNQESKNSGKQGGKKGGDNVGDNGRDGGGDLGGDDEGNNRGNNEDDNGGIDQGDNIGGNRGDNEGINEGETEDENGGGNEDQDGGNNRGGDGAENGGDNGGGNGGDTRDNLGDDNGGDNGGDDGGENGGDSGGDNRGNRGGNSGGGGKEIDLGLDPRAGFTLMDTGGVSMALPAPVLSRMAEALGTTFSQDGLGPIECSRLSGDGALVMRFNDDAVETRVPLANMRVSEALTDPSLTSRGLCELGVRAAGQGDTNVATLPFFAAVYTVFDLDNNRLFFAPAKGDPSAPGGQLEEFPLDKSGGGEPGSPGRKPGSPGDEPGNPGEEPGNPGEEPGKPGGESGSPDEGDDDSGEGDDDPGEGEDNSGEEGDNLGEGGDNLGQGEDNLGQGKDNLGQGKDNNFGEGLNN